MAIASDDFTDIFQKAYAGLNEEQKKAVDELYGPVMVVAGPGTGKTQLLALRAANLIYSNATSANNILITTYTDAGCIAIKKRLRSLIGPSSYQITVSTIHAFCNEIIQNYPEKFLSLRAQESMDSAESFELIEEILSQNTIKLLTTDTDKTFYVRPVASAISTLKKEAVSVEDLRYLIAQLEARNEEEIATFKPNKTNEAKAERMRKQSAKLHELRYAYGQYLELCAERGLYDYDDMIGYVIAVLSQDDELKYEIAEKYQFVMIDEFQDSNSSQNRIFDIIMSVSDNHNILVVGDDDQSIYRFQGANIENMWQFREKYGQTQFVTLNKNYRSQKAILEAASATIQNNEQRLCNVMKEIDKHLEACSPLPSCEPYVWECESQLEEQALVLEQIKKKLDAGLSVTEMAILVRTNKEVEEWSNLLQDEGIACESKLSDNVLSSPYVRMLYDIFCILANPYAQDTRIINLLMSGMLDIPKGDVLRINRAMSSLNYTRDAKFSFFEVLQNPNALPADALQNPEAITRFVSLVQNTQMSQHTTTFYQYFKEVLEGFGFISYVLSRASFYEIENIYTLLEVAKSWSEKKENFSVGDFLKKMDMHHKYNISIPSRVKKGSQEGVAILTAHSAKGLEWDTVFVPSLVEGVWPSKGRASVLSFPQNFFMYKEASENDSNVKMEEERRLFFVALTRAKQDLFLLSPKSSNKKAQTTPSPFLWEINIPLKTAPQVDASRLLLATLQKSKQEGSSETQDNFSDEELLQIVEIAKNQAISPSDLNKFLSSPLMYFRESLLKYPFEDNFATIFGSVYHKTLEEFFLAYKKTRKLPSEHDLQNLFLLYLSKKTLPPNDRERMKEKGVAGLEGWYKFHQENGWREACEIEYSFRFAKIQLDDTIPLSGKIDKLEWVDKNKNIVALIDYKTGAVKSENALRGNTKEANKNYFRQLGFYYILCELDPSIAKKYTVGEAGIEFVEGRDGKFATISFSLSHQEIEEVRQEIRTMYTSIIDVQFWRDVFAGKINTLAPSTEEKASDE